MSMKDTVVTFDHLADRMPPVPGHVLLGLSGGADSMALCRILMCLRERGHVAFSAVHVNHGLRGQESDGDEQFVRDFCLRHDIPLIVTRLTPPEHPGENWAREARYAAFADALRTTGAQAVCLAHHREDQAETLMMHLMRGAGLTGLCGMRPESVTLGVPVVRPLLEISRAELRDALGAARQPWREDGSNATDAYLRNRVRRQLLPMMETLLPGAEERIARTAVLLQPEDALLTRMAQDALKGAGETYLPLRLLQDAPAELHPRMMRTWLADYAITGVQMAAMCALADMPVGATCNLPGGRQGYRGYRCIHVTGGKVKASAPVAVTGEGAYAAGGVTLMVSPGSVNPGDGRYAQEMPASLLEGCEVRTRRTGDVIRPFGMAGTQSLQDYLVNRRVDAPFRDRIPLLCRGSEVLLVAGVGAGNVPRWGGSDDMMRLTWNGCMPWADV
ncbi:MAG: tRNA lysidine(34) synthetase TilS [Clostridia bacterium]|nr:tRNA lysidine(34) synthetase TilS [Clostridia bacterium]